MGLAESYKIRCQLRVQDKLTSFGVAYECTSGFDAATGATDLTDGFLNIVNTSLLACLASDVTFEGLYATSLVADSAMPNGLPGNSNSGLRTGTSAPANLCAVITLQTDDPTAVRQGRIYLSGISKDDIVSGLFEANFVDNQLKLFADALALPLSSGGKTFEPRIVQRILAGAPVGPNLLPVVAARVTNIPYSQRRRTTRQFGYGP